MAVKASATLTLVWVIDVRAVTRYYLLRASTAAAPAKPTAKPPGGGWTLTEPAYTDGSTNTLYTVDLTVFSDDTYAYSDVSRSSGYEAAKAAYNKAAAAANAAAALRKDLGNYATKTESEASIKQASDEIRLSVSQVQEIVNKKGGSSTGGTPAVPYTVGDLWTDGTNLYSCIRASAEAHDGYRDALNAASQPFTAARAATTGLADKNGADLTDAPGRVLLTPDTAETLTVTDPSAALLADLRAKAAALGDTLTVTGNVVQLGPYILNWAAYRAADWAVRTDYPTAETTKSLIEQTARSITLSVTNGSTGSALTLKVGSTVLSSANITLSGLVSFEALSGSGKTVVNGDNITTGTLRCSLLDTGTISHANSYWNMASGEIRSGTSGGTRVDITPGTINWYKDNLLTGVLHSVVGNTFIGANSRRVYYGWLPNGRPDGSSYHGFYIDNEDYGGLMHLNLSKFEIPGRIECSSLSVNGREI